MKRANWLTRNPMPPTIAHLTKVVETGSRCSTDWAVVYAAAACGSLTLDSMAQCYGKSILCSAR